MFQEKPMSAVCLIRCLQNFSTELAECYIELASKSISREICVALILQALIR